MDKKVLKAIVQMQSNELTEYYIYSNIAKKVKKEEDKKILLQIAAEELRHAKIWEEYSKQKAKPKKGKIRWMCILTAILGYTFVLKKMESGEELAQDVYSRLIAEVPDAETIMKEEKAHETALLNLLDEERLMYVGSMVLGLNDALVELSGTLAGMVFALQDTKLVALSGLITGIAATLSMGASNYLAEKSEGKSNALKSSSYTGIAYLITVAILVMPYLVIENVFVALGVMIGAVVLIILVFNYYISVAKGLPFKKRFLEMLIISLSVAAISFAIGLIVKNVLGIDI